MIAAIKIHTFDLSAEVNWFLISLYTLSAQHRLQFVTAFQAKETRVETFARCQHSTSPTNLPNCFEIYSIRCFRRCSEPTEGHMENSLSVSIQNLRIRRPCRLTSNETSLVTTDAIRRVYIFSKLFSHTQVIYSNWINSEIEIQLYLSPVTILLFEFTQYHMYHMGLFCPRRFNN